MVDLLNMAVRFLTPGIHRARYPVWCLLFSMFLMASCTIIRQKPAGKPYILKSNIEVKGGNFTKLEKADILQKLRAQIEDSASNRVKDVAFVLHFIKKPPALDTAWISKSARNMEAVLFHQGYYRTQVLWDTDTSHNRQVRVKYTVLPGKPTLISSYQYNLRKPDLQSIAVQSSSASTVRINQPVTKSGINTEINRLVDSFRNNGYYKFTPAELSMRGDTSLEVLTSAADDPFEQLRLLSEAEKKRDSPQIKLALVLKPPADSTILQPYRIGKIYLLTDFQPGDQPDDSSGITETHIRNFILRQREPNIRHAYLNRTIPFRTGQLINQSEISNTLNRLAKSGVWKNVTLQIREVPDTPQQANLVVEMLPNLRLNFQAALEASYAASTNILAGNLFGFSLNFTILNRNFKKQAIRMTHNFRAGIELNNKSRGTNISTINSTQISYANSIVLPQLIWPYNRIFTRNTRLPEAFVNSSVGYSNRLNLFNLQALALNQGIGFFNKKGHKFYWKPLNVEFSYLYNETDSFRSILNENPFLRYSYNTALVMGMAAGFSSNKINMVPLKNISKEKSLRFNIEESGLTWGLLPILEKYKRRYIKADIEFKYTLNYSKTSLVFRLFGGYGLPLLGSDSNRTLPFFKQYFGGGSNSLRGWPIRGIGPGGKALIPYSSSETVFNDRTGDMQLEGNIEYRFMIAPIIPNTLLMRGAVFVDMGNIWNVRNTIPGSGKDTAQFTMPNLYSQLGLSAGTGIRLDFSNLILRFDFGFRFKRPDLYYVNDGWKAPDIGFDDFLKKIFTRGPNDEYRKWRYENFNFSIGVSYPF